MMWLGLALALLCALRSAGPGLAALGGGDGLPSPPAAKGSVVPDWVRKVGSGPAGIAALGALEALALLLCLPGYSTMEYAAGALFGGLPGLVACIAAKGGAAIIAFVLIRTLRDSPAGRWAEQRVAGGGGSRGGARWAERLQHGIKKDTFKFCLLVRCSPLPAWLSNYALPLAGVPFWTYLPASLIGMIPPIATNVYAGAAAGTFATAITGQTTTGGGGIGLTGLVALGVSVLSSTMLVHQLSSCDPDQEASPNASDGAPSAVGVGAEPQDA